MDYKEKLEAARKWHAIVKEQNNQEAIKILEELFPELKESEDERIRKEIVDYLKKFIPHCDYDLVAKSKLWIAWLEKQGEQKPADKVETKFKVGDWINKDGAIWRIEGVSDKEYILGGRSDVVIQEPIPIINSEFHLWTIQDAKDGDVLATKEGYPFLYDKNRYNNRLAYYYAGINVYGELKLKSPCNMLNHFGELHSVFPATKEQCDLLFAKIKEAGYEWNNNKKELKKLA